MGLVNDVKKMHTSDKLLHTL